MSDARAVWNRRSLIGSFLTDTQGQVLPFVTVVLLGLLGMATLSIDVGRAVWAYRTLQVSSDAAALAGARAINTASSTATITGTSVTNGVGGVVGAYSSSAAGGGTYNVRSNLPAVTETASLECLQSLQTQGLACVGSVPYNAVKVQQTTNLPTFFARLLGHPTLAITTVSTAAAQGASSTPANVIIVVDTTASMNDTDSDSNCASTRISCALTGVRTLLGSLSPCGSGLSSCSSSSTPVDQVSLFAFPGLASAADAQKDYTCPTSNPSIAPYSYSASLSNYQITGLTNGYRSSDSANSLSSGSNLVVATGGGSCNGLQAPGGEGTYYAGVIYSAQAALVATNPNPSTSGIDNILIVLSDGDASTTSNHISGPNCSSKVTTNCWTASGTYPSLVDQCQQAVTAAAAATTAGTKVYTVAYGAASSGCATDNPSITPCQTMERMASAPQYFYSDYTATGGSSSCISAAQSTSNLNQIFKSIAGSLTVARLIPNSMS